MLLSKAKFRAEVEEGCGEQASRKGGVFMTLKTVAILADAIAQYARLLTFDKSPLSARTRER